MEFVCFLWVGFLQALVNVLCRRPTRAQHEELIELPAYLHGPPKIHNPDIHLRPIVKLWNVLDQSEENFFVFG
jgi:hypothetical protein